MFFAGQTASATLSAGGGNTLMLAIAAAVIGGTSLFGGRGSVWSALLGMLVIQSIQTGLDLLEHEHVHPVHDHRRGPAGCRGHRLRVPQEPEGGRPRLARPSGPVPGTQVVPGTVMSWDSHSRATRRTARSWVQPIA